MSYIGKSPSIGAYSMLDNLTASATASYSLTLDSVAFVPESANHLLVSLNGSIQKAGSSYTVSGSTLTFSSTLASSDSIDFVLALGSVLDIGTPSDATVTNAKTNFVSTSSSAGLQIKGDGTTDGTLQLNCSQNSHGIKLKSPAHSASQSYTLTFPTTSPSADKFLKTDGSGNLSFADAGGGLKQVVQGTFDTAVSTSSHNTMVDTGLTVNITPTSASNKVLCFFNANVQPNTGQYSGGLSIVRGSTAIRTASSGNNRATAQFWAPSDAYHMNHFTGMVLDSPNTTSQTTYKVQFASGYSGQTVYMNRGYGNNNHFDSTSTIIVMEVAV